jgi:hypothetical protein
MGPHASTLEEVSMNVVREPVLRPMAIADLYPTQITVGMREVVEKRKQLRERPLRKIGKFLGAHMMPVALAGRWRGSHA